MIKTDESLLVKKMKLGRMAGERLLKKRDEGGEAGLERMDKLGMLWVEIS